MTMFMILLSVVFICFLIIGHNCMMSRVDNVSIMTGIATFIGIVLVLAIIAEGGKNWTMIPNDEYNAMERACINAGVGTYTTTIHQNFKVLPSAEKE